MNIVANNVLCVSGRVIMVMVAVLHVFRRSNLPRLYMDYFQSFIRGHVASISAISFNADQCYNIFKSASNSEFVDRYRNVFSKNSGNNVSLFSECTRVFKYFTVYCAYFSGLEVVFLVLSAEDPRYGKNSYWGSFLRELFILFILREWAVGVVAY